jgi:hypothetical protein
VSQISTSSPGFLASQLTPLIFPLRYAIILNHYWMFKWISHCQTVSSIKEWSCVYLYP